MTKISIRFRDYVDPRKRGMYLCVNGKQIQKIADYQLSRKEIEAYRAQYVAILRGYQPSAPKTMRKRVRKDKYIEIKELPYNTEVTEIEQDFSGRFVPEKPDQRDYVENNDADALNEVLDKVENAEPSGSVYDDEDSFDDNAFN